MPNNPDVIVNIPPIGREERIGSVLNHVFLVMYQTDNTQMQYARKIIWDFSDCSFLHPFFLGALSVLKKLYGDVVECRNINPQISHYLDLIYFHDPLQINNDQNDNSLWERYKGKSYLPICVFDAHNGSSEIAQNLIKSAVTNQIGGKLVSVLSYLLSELIDNITDHSKSKVGYVFCQKLPRQNSLCVFIADTGRSIYSSYATDERYADSLGLRESSGLVMALNGKSTKNRPESENRGFGISKSRELIVNGLKGEFLMLSGSAFARHDSNGVFVADLPGDLRWNGTIALLKVPINIPNELNIYDYIG